MRAPRFVSFTLPLLAVAAVLTGVLGHQASAKAPSSPAPSSYQPTLPVNATFFYAVQADNYSHSHHDTKTDYSDAEVIRRQISDMQYAGQQVGIFSWFGRGSYPDHVFAEHLRAADDTSFRWAILDEEEGGGHNPSVAAIRDDLSSIYSRFAKDPSYFKVGGKPVLFTYGDANDGCGAAARWRAADSQHRFYLVMRNVKDYTHCSPQPNSWYAYGPSSAVQRTTNAYDVSPGYFKTGDKAPALRRSPARFAADLKAMKSAKVRFKLTTTWNEWTEDTGVESAREWRSKSGHGRYVDLMHAVLGSAPNPPPAPHVLNVATSGEDVKLAWESVADASSYQVFRNGCLLATVHGTSYLDTSLTDTSAAYSVKSANFRGTSRRGPVKIGVAGTPVAAPATKSNEGVVALSGSRILSTSTGDGTGCSLRQRGQALVKIPSSVPAKATAVVVTVTALNSLGNGTVQLYPAGTSAPPVSALRYYSSRATSNTAVVPIGTGRQLVVQEGGAATHLYLDVTGYVAPRMPGLVVHSPAGERFLDTRSGIGGVRKSRVAGTITVHVPDYVPTTATALQVRLLVTGASHNGQATAYEGGMTRPHVTSLAYARAVALSASVLVPIDSQHRTVSVYLSSVTHVVAGVEGWITAGGQASVDVDPTRLVPAGHRTTSRALTFAQADRGHIVLLNIGVATAAGYGNLSVRPDGAAAPLLPTMSFGPQQPQSGFVWVRVPANGIIRVSLTEGAQLFVDELALA